MVYTADQFSYKYVSRSLRPIITIMTAALTPSSSSYVETFQFSAGQRTVWVSVMSS